jgi:hypothetical protein
MPPCRCPALLLMLPRHIIHAAFTLLPPADIIAFIAAIYADAADIYFHAAGL